MAGLHVHDCLMFAIFVHIITSNKVYNDISSYLDDQAGAHQRTPQLGLANRTEESAPKQGTHTA